MRLHDTEHKGEQMLSLIPETALETNRRALLWGLDRVAFYFETDDPHLRHEAHLVAKHDLTHAANELSEEH